MILANQSSQRSRINTWLMGAVAIFAFCIGGLAAIGLMQLPKIFAGDSATQQASATPTPAAAEIVVEEPAAEVTRVASPELLVVAEPVQAEAVIAEPVVEEEVPAPTPAVATIPSATQALADKEASIAEAIAIANRNKIRMLTEGVVAGLYDVTVEDDTGETRIALRSRNAATTAEQLQALITTAAQDGLIDVPEAERADGGGVDTETLLFDIVQTSLANGTADEAQAAQELRQRAFAASDARTVEADDGRQVYTVERGDSLAYIALQFYGNSRAYDRIFQANLDQLTSPDEIKVGQRLVIPNG